VRRKSTSAMYHAGLTSLHWRQGMLGPMTRIHRRIAAVAVGALGLLAMPSPASADLTAFLGVNGSPTNRVVQGFAGAAGLLVVGFEVEYAGTKEDLVEHAPSLHTFMFNGLAQTPIPIGGMQFYATAGGGLYRETLQSDSETNVGINVGGGVKMKLAGPL